jgi:DNA-binding MarR family transcriptional regulator
VKGLTNRTADPADGRGYLLSHTTKGSELLAAALTAHVAQLNDLLGPRLPTATHQRLLKDLAGFDDRL